MGAGAVVCNDDLVLVAMSSERYSILGRAGIRSWRILSSPQGRHRPRPHLLTNTQSTLYNHFILDYNAGDRFSCRAFSVNRPDSNVLRTFSER